MTARDQKTIHSLLKRKERERERKKEKERERKKERKKEKERKSKSKSKRRRKRETKEDLKCRKKEKRRAFKTKHAQKIINIINSRSLLMNITIKSYMHFVTDWAIMITAALQSLKTQFHGSGVIDSSPSAA